MNREQLRYLLFLWGVRAVFVACLALVVGGREMLAYGLAVVAVVVLALVEHGTRDID